MKIKKIQKRAIKILRPRSEDSMVSIWGQKSTLFRPKSLRPMKSLNVPKTQSVLFKTRNKASRPLENRQE